SDRRGGAGAGAVGGHGGAAGDSPASAARDHGAGAGARSRDSRGDPGVSALPIFGEQGAGSPALYGVALREAVLADVTQLEALMAPYVQTGDLLPRSNYDLRDDIFLDVAAAGVGSAAYVTG